MKKTVVITGGARGMGRAAARTLADAGYFVYSLDIQPGREDPDDIRNRYIRELQVDVCCQESIDKAYRQISAEVDRLDGILHFAGMILMDSLVEIPEEQFLKIFQVNLFGAYRINKTFLPLILASGPKGRILLTTSELAPNKIIPFNSIYSISKKALDAYAEGLRMELGLLGVQVITLRPGAVATDLIGHSNRALETLKSNTKLYRDNTKKFQKIMDAEQGTAIPAERIGELVLNILTEKHPRYIYTTNASKKLKLLNIVPTGIQVKLYRKLLK